MIVEKTRTCFILAIGCILLSQALMAQESPQNSAWVSLGPEGGPISAFAQDPSNSNILYVAPSSSHRYDPSIGWEEPCRIHKSMDKGNSWVGISQIDDWGVAIDWNNLSLSREFSLFGRTAVHCLAIDPNNTSVLYAATYGAVHKSVDSGVTWSRYGLEGGWNSIYDIAVDPTDSNVLHACGDAYDGDEWLITYFKSTDGGAHWSTHRLPGESDWGFAWGIAVAVDPANPDHVFVGGTADSAEIYKSIDGGKSWSDISSGITGWAVDDIEIDPVSTDKVYVLTSEGVYRSSDGGSSWSKNEGWAEGNKLAIDPNNTDVLYVHSYGSCLKSRDGGVHWSRHGKGLSGGWCSAIAVDNASSDTVFFTGKNGFFRSTNGGGDWTSSNSGLFLANITALKLAPSSPSIMYAAFEYDAVFKTHNAIEAQSSMAMAWDRLPEFYACDNVTDIEVDPVDPDVVYAFEGGG